MAHPVNCFALLPPILELKPRVCGLLDYLSAAISETTFYFL